MPKVVRREGEEAGGEAPIQRKPRRRLAKWALGVGAGAALSAGVTGAYLGSETPLDAFVRGGSAVTASAESGKTGFDLRRAEVARKARGFLGQRYGRDLTVCTDVYVRACEDAGLPVSDEMRKHFRSLPDPSSVYAKAPLQWAGMARGLHRVWDSTLGEGFDNNPDNPFFVRRLQNLVAWQISNGVYWTAGQVERGEVVPKVGMAVYWRPKNPGLGRSDFPTHVGVVSEVSGGRITKVVQASSSRGVVEDPHAKVLESMVFVGVGDLPSSMLKK